MFNWLFTRKETQYEIVRRELRSTKGRDDAYRLGYKDGSKGESSILSDTMPSIYTEEKYLWVGRTCRANSYREGFDAGRRCYLEGKLNKRLIDTK